MASNYRTVIRSETEYPAGFCDEIPSFPSSHSCLSLKDSDRDESWMYGDELILLVDDNPMVLGSTKAILETYGYTVLHAESAKDAIQIATNHTDAIQMLITDIIMPGMNGRNLANHLLANYPNMKCLYMSGYSNGILADLSNLGENASFIQKPFSVNSLAAKVREILDKQRISTR